MGHSELPDKLFFKIGEVGQIVGVKPHVLRYWESEFPALRPLKTRGSHRMYRRRDVELAVLLRRLLHEERLTVAGAKKRLREMTREVGGASGQTEPEVSPKQEVSDRATFIALRRQLSDLLLALDRLANPEMSEVESPRATVTSATPSTVPVHSQKAFEEEIGSCSKPRSV